MLLLLPLLRGRPAEAAASPIASWNAKVVPLPVNHVAYDATRQKVLAVVPGSQPSLGNELVELDPDTGAIGRHVFVGSNPSRIALTDDGTAAFIGLRGVNRIARVDLQTFTLHSSFATPPDSFLGNRFVEDLEAVPGRNDMVVASLMNSGFSPRHEGVWVFKDGLALANRTPGHTGSNRIVVASATTAYGYNNETTDFGFRAMSIDASGITVTSSGATAISGFGTDIELAGGRVYATTGIVLDPVTRGAVGSYGASGLVEVTPADGRTTFLSGSTISIFQTASGLPVESAPFAQLGSGTNTELAATATGFAVANTAGVVLLGPAVGGGAVTLPPPPPSLIGALQPVEISLPVADLAYDESRNRLYASVPSASGARQDQVVALDPDTGAVLDSLFVGSNPGPLALTGDRSRLHVGLSTTGQVAQLDLSTFTRVGDFSLGNDPFFGALVAEDIEVMPGTVNTLAASLRNTCCSPRHMGVAVYDSGVRRTNVTPGHTGANRIEFGSASALYGSNNETTGFGFYRMAVDAAGVTRISETGNLLPGFGGDIELTGGLVYATSGLIVDPEKAELAGRLPAAGAVEVIPSQGRAYFLESSSLAEIDLAGQRLVSRQTIGSGFPRALVATGDGLAASFDNGKLILLTLTPPVPPTVTSVAPASGSRRGGTAVTIGGTGFSSTTSVTFGGTPAQSYNVVSASEIHAVTPAHVVGEVPVVVTTGGGTSPEAAAARFTFVTVPPAVSGVSPPSGGTGGGTEVTISGTGFLDVESVKFGATAASFTVVSPTEIRVMSPVRPAGEVVVTVTSTDGSSADVPASRFTYHAPAVVPVTPARILETRGLVGQVGYSGSKPAPGQVVQLPVAGRGGVPATGAGAVVLNLTATEATGAGYVTAWACGTPRPGTSSLNVERIGHTVANLVVVSLGTAGDVCLFTQSGTHLIADVTGWLPAAAGFAAVSPARLLETRTAAGQVGFAGSKPGAGQVVQLQVTGRGGVPSAGVGAVVLNLTGTEATGPGFVTAWPCGTPRPGTSSLNLERAGHTVANLVVVGVGAGGTVCLFTQSGTHLIADVTGWLPVASGFSAVTPARLLETRTSAGQAGYSGPKPAADQVVQLDVASRGGVPPNGAGAVVLNLTATEATGAGFVTAWPCGAPRPGTSSLNVERAGQTVSNLVVVGLGSAGRVCLYTQAGTHLIADVTGWFPG